MTLDELRRTLGDLPADLPGDTLVLVHDGETNYCYAHLSVSLIAVRQLDPSTYQYTTVGPHSITALVIS